MLGGFIDFVSPASFMVAGFLKSIHSQFISKYPPRSAPLLPHHS